MRALICSICSRARARAVSSRSSSRSTSQAGTRKRRSRVPRLRTSALPTPMPGETPRPVMRMASPRRIRASTSAQSAASACSSSAPSAEIVIDRSPAPRRAAAGPGCSCRPFRARPGATRMRALKPLAAWTNLAAARACSPSGLTIVTAHEVTAFSPRSRSDATQMALRPSSRISRASVSRSRLLRRPRQLDQHRQVDAGDDLDLAGSRNVTAEVRRRAAEHVGQHQHARRLVRCRPPTLHARDRPADLLARHGRRRRASRSRRR